jgi:hypothetical protein
MGLRKVKFLGIKENLLQKKQKIKVEKNKLNDLKIHKKDKE